MSISNETNSQTTDVDEPDPRRWWALAAMGLSVVAVGLDVTVLNIALPTLAADLDAGTSELQWIADSYVVIMAALLLPFGLLGDRLGRKRILLIGLGVFAASSLLATYSDNVATLVAARALMGVGAAILIPVTIAVLPSIFPDRERPRAIAALTAGMALGMPLGPLVGGWLLENFWWGSVFLINVPTCAVAAIAVIFLMPETRDPSAPRLQPAATALAVVGLASLVFAIIEAPERGWTDPLTVAALVVGLAMLTAFAVRQLTSARPMVDLRLFANRVFLWGSVAAALGSLCMMGVLFILPQYLQVVRDNTAFGTGLRLLPLIAGIMVAGAASDRITAKFGYRPVITVGLGVFAAGFAFAATTDIDSGYGMVATWMVIAGIGMGLTMIPAMDAVLASLPKDREGAGSALTQTVRQVAGALGIAGLGAILSSVYGNNLTVPEDMPPELAERAEDSIAGAARVSDAVDDDALLADATGAFMDGMTAVYLVCAAGAILSMVLIARFFPKKLASRTVEEEELPYDHADTGTS